LGAKLSVLRTTLEFNFLSAQQAVGISCELTTMKMKKKVGEVFPRVSNVSTGGAAPQQ
jgi:hypothetical protein